MSNELVKIIDGNYHITAGDKNKFVKQILMPLIMNQVKELGLEKYEDFSKARQGLPDIFIDGKKKSISNLSKFVFNRLQDSEHQKGLSLKDSETSAKNKKIRRDNIRIQSQGLDLVDKYDWNSTPELMEGHHKRAVQIYSAFYEGLDPDGPEAKQLTQHFVDEGFPLGDAKSNIEELTQKEHDEIHRWMQEHGIQVPVGKPGESNFTTNKLGQTIVRGGADNESEALRSVPRPVIPNMSHLDINQRKLAATEYLHFVQKPVEEEIKKIKNKVSLYRPKQSEINAMRSIGLKWDKDAGKFISIQNSNLPTEYSTNKPGGFNLSNLFSIGPDPRNSHLLKQVTAENIIAHENRYIDTVGNVAAKGLEHSVNAYTGSKLGTNVKTGINIGQKIKNKDPLGAVIEATNLESVSYEKIIDPTKLTAGY